MASEYFTRTPERGVTQLYHKSDRKQPVSTIHSAFEKMGLFGGKDRVFRVTNQPNASKQRFQSLDSAIAHSVAVHKQNQAGGHDAHPIVRIAHHINNVGDAIEDASSDPRLNEHQQNHLLLVSKAYAGLVDLFNKGFGK